MITNQLLYQLSYVGAYREILYKRRFSECQ